MSDADNDYFRLDSLFVATTLTTILIAGSAYLWHTNLRLLPATQGSILVSDHVSSNSSDQSLGIADAKCGDPDKSKSVRSKERRRRGKDPFRDILKNGKKLKALSKLSLTPQELDRMNDVKVIPLPQTADSSRQQSSVDASIASSSRSVSTSRSRTRNAQHESYDVESSRHSNGGGGLQAMLERSPNNIPAGLTVSGTDNAPPSKPSTHDLESKYQQSESEEPLDLLTARPSDPSESPDLALPIPRPTSHSHVLLNPSLADPVVQPPAISVSTSLPAVAIKPKQSSSTSQTSLPIHSTSLSLIAPIATSRPRCEQNISYLDGGNGLYSSRGFPTPRRTPTPSSRANSPPPSLATQTQIASLRGALEAARQREAQMKSELEYFRWESTGWKRRELELQNQIQFLVHQLQTIAASSSVPPNSVALNSPSSSILPSSPNASPSKKAYQAALPPENPTPIPTLQPQPPSLHIVTPPSTRVPQTPSMFSPLSVMHPVPPPVYYAYPHVGGNQHNHLQSHNFSHFSPQVPPHMRSFPVSPIQLLTNQAGVMSVFSHSHAASPSPGPTASGPPSATGSSSSVGSTSPDVGSSPAMLGRGRRKTRGNVQMGEWVELGESEGLTEEDARNGDDGETEVSEVLADAILKRPGSLGLGKTWGKKSRSTAASKLATVETGPLDFDSAEPEFTFPSLSDLGNVNWGKKAKMDYGSDFLEDARINGSSGLAAEEETLNPHHSKKIERPGAEAQDSLVERSRPSSELPAG